MADTPPGDFPPRLSKPARRALAGAGYLRLAQLTTVRESELARLHGLGPKALRQLREALAARGATFAGPAARRAERRFTAAERQRDEAAMAALAGCMTAREMR